MVLLFASKLVFELAHLQLQLGLGFQLQNDKTMIIHFVMQMSFL